MGLKHTTAHEDECLDRPDLFPVEVYKVAERLDEKITDLDDEITAKDKEIEALQEEIEKLEDRIAELEADLENADASRNPEQEP